MSKAKEHLDLWMKQIAPSTDLRKAWNHNPNTILEFAESYRRELDANPAVEQLEQILADHPVVTFVYGARDPLVNHARILRDYVEERQKVNEPPAPPIRYDGMSSAHSTNRGLPV